MNREEVSLQSRFISGRTERCEGSELTFQLLPFPVSCIHGSTVITSPPQNICRVWRTLNLTIKDSVLELISPKIYIESPPSTPPHSDGDHGTILFYSYQLTLVRRDLGPGEHWPHAYRMRDETEKENRPKTAGKKRRIPELCFNCSIISSVISQHFQAPCF